MSLRTILINFLFLYFSHTHKIVIPFPVGDSYKSPHEQTTGDVTPIYVQVLIPETDYNTAYGFPEINCNRITYTVFNDNLNTFFERF